MALLETALEKHIYGNNQHMEGVIKHFKGQPDKAMNCDEPALYFYTSFEDSKASNRTFVAGLEKAKWEAERHQGSNKAKTIVENTQQKTEDAVENEALMTEDAV